jgi:glutamate/tyrosine decarboxylase-like PLP-dependent enzyme
LQFNPLMPSLELSPAEFRCLADEVARICAEFLATLDQQPAYPSTSGTETERLFREPLPEHGLGSRVLARVSDLLTHSRVPSPRFFGYVFGSGEPVAGLGDLLASVLNQNVTAWRSAPAAVTVERTVVAWLAEAVGCAGFTGSLTGGGSSANLMALAMAREKLSPANERGARPSVVYASQEAHMSVGKAVALLGLGRQNIHVVPTDEHFRIMPQALERAIEQTKRSGRKAVAIVASAGTVSTGAIDPLPEIAAIARRHGLWLHVDGAYGALAAIAMPEKFAGLDLADSLSLDPHKWLYQPVDCGCLLFKDAEAARVAFAHTAEYTKVLNTDPGEAFAFFEESTELSRRFRALKLWLSLRYHGLAAFREAICADLAHAQRLAQKIEAEHNLELLAPVELSAVCFRLRKPGMTEGELNPLNIAVLKRILQRGRVFISNASIVGKFALRACFVNHRTKDADVDEVVHEVLQSARDCGL